MAVIGKFRCDGEILRGRIQTLSLDTEVEFRPCRKDHEKAPDYRIHASCGEFGAAWRRVSAANRDYLSCKFDDLLFPSAVYASLILSDDDETYLMIWTR